MNNPTPKTAAGRETLDWYWPLPDQTSVLRPFAESQRDDAARRLLAIEAEVWNSALTAVREAGQSWFAAAEWQPACRRAGQKDTWTHIRLLIDRLASEGPQS